MVAAAILAAGKGTRMKSDLFELFIGHDSFLLSLLCITTYSIHTRGLLSRWQDKSVP